ncbi:ROK family transcriptional regulator [Nocardioides sp. zg-1308]|uniref:ROK family transcriptional regulator n=1 Tax=Nocardioides sp. zg-1308 TaxID=2736253 RepID=UPI0015571396|nr:ROK family transcriptional regulator [Nocardioides sp. zg-1308]NPD06971.1 ROK family transcriptional regulator [Nocardioides sp. zg-1308]
MTNGPGDILELIRHREMTRGDVLEATGMSRMTLTQRLDALFGAGLIIEGSTTGATGGRRRRSLAFNTAQSHVLVASIETTHARIAVADLGGTVLDEVSLDVAVADGPSHVLDRIATGMTELMAALGVARSALCGIGLSLPGPVDPETGRPSQPPILPGWDAYPISEHLQSALPGVPVLTANDADAAAMGEYAAGHAGARSLLLVKVSTGIGTGIVIDGRSYTGVDGGAGDIGHVRVSPGSDIRCQCGMHGCLAAVASGRAVAAELTARGVPAASGREVRALLQSGDAEAATLTQEAGRRIGEVMATVVCLINPEVVLIGGALASAPLLAGMRETLYRLALPRATRHMALQLGALDEEAAVVGLTRLVVDQEFAPAAINSRLRG